MRPQIRSAFRRLVSLYESLRQVAAIAETKEDESQIRLDKIRAIVDVQTAMADDALEDWADVDEESVEELRKRLRKEAEKGAEE